TQLIDAIVPRRWQIEVPPWIERRASYVKYAVLAGAVGWFLLSGDISFYRYIEPFWMFTFQASTALWIGLAALLVASVFVRNLYCRFLCPVGAALGLLSTLSVFRIKRWSECSQCKVCENACEWGAIRARKIVVTECVRCDDCEHLYGDRARCPHWLLDAKRRRQAAEPVEHRVDVTSIGRPRPRSEPCPEDWRKLVSDTFSAEIGVGNWCLTPFLRGTVSDTEFRRAGSIGAVNR